MPLIQGFSWSEVSMSVDRDFATIKVGFWVEPIAVQEDPKLSRVANQSVTSTPLGSSKSFVDHWLAVLAKEGSILLLQVQ